MFSNLDIINVNRSLLIFSALILISSIFEDGGKRLELSDSLNEKIFSLNLIAKIFSFREIFFNLESS